MNLKSDSPPSQNWRTRIAPFKAGTTASAFGGAPVLWRADARARHASFVGQPLWLPSATKKRQGTATLQSADVDKLTHDQIANFGKRLIAVRKVIAYLEGVLIEALPTQLLVGVNGIGYQVLIPLSSFDKLPPTGSPIHILTHLQVREDAHILYGFMTLEERDLFRLLITHVSGIGPKLALAVLSGMSVSSFQAAVVNSDITSISKISGLGRKTAERIVLELKDKVGVAAAWEASSAAHAPSEEQKQINDAVLALISLGYKQVDAHKAVKQALAAAKDGVSSEDLVRHALKLLM
jgi:holliday junction DNA helicase RuvA